MLPAGQRCMPSTTCINYHRNFTLIGKLAAIDWFIAELPDGYDTIVGERGIKLFDKEKNNGLRSLKLF